MSRYLPALLLVAACSSGGDKDPPVDVNEDTFDSAALDGWDTSDTGVVLAFVYDGAASVAGDRFVGWEAFTVRWLSGRGLSEPRCAQVSQASSWAHAPSRDGTPSPLTPAQLALCEGCAFAFSLSLDGQVNQPDLPAPPAPLPPDTDVDTDTDVDGATES